MKLSDYKVSQKEIRLFIQCTMDAWNANFPQVRMPALNVDNAIILSKDLWKVSINTPEDLPRILALDPYHTCIYSAHNHMDGTLSYRLESEPESVVVHDIVTMLILQTAARNYLS